MVSQVRDLLAALEDAKTQPSTSVTAVTGVPTLSTDNREHFMQGLERFIVRLSGAFIRH